MDTNNLRLYDHIRIIIFLCWKLEIINNLKKIVVRTDTASFLYISKFSFTTELKKMCVIVLETETRKVFYATR